MKRHLFLIAAVGVRRLARRLRKRALFSKRVREGAKMFLLLSKEQ
jgi:hypothetical protein